MKVFIRDTILDSDISRGFHIPKIKSYLTNIQIKAIESFIKDQKGKGVNFKIDDKYEVDIKGFFEVSKIIYEYYKSNEKVQKRDTENLLDAIKLCAKHIKKCSFEMEFRKLLEIRDTKYFNEYDLENYRHYFNEPFIQSLKKQSSKYPVLLFNEVVTVLDTINKKGYKNKETRLSQELKELILKIFDMKAKVLRVEDKKEYEIDVKSYREAIKFYFEMVRRYLGNESIINGSKEITLDNLESIVVTAYPLKNYECLCVTEENYLKTQSLIKRLELYKILTTDKKEEAKKVIAEIEAECLEMIERQPFLHGFNIEHEELFYSVVKQIQTIEQCEKLDE